MCAFLGYSTTHKGFPMPSSSGRCLPHHLLLKRHFNSWFIFPTGKPLSLVGNSDANWAGCPDTRRSVTGWCMFFGPDLISLKSKKQSRVSKSSTESEYQAMSMACSEIIWLRGLLAEIGFPQIAATPL